MSEELPLVTVLIPARNEVEWMLECLDAVAEQDYPSSRLEVLVVDGGSTDGTAALVESRMRANPFASCEIVDNPAGSTPVGLNLGLARARGEVLCRVDARSRIPVDYVSTCVDVLLSRPEVAVVGGAQVAVARSPQARDLGIARALNNRWGMGGSRYRRGAASGPADTVYLGAFRTAQLRACGGWDERFATNQDFELNRRMSSVGMVWFESRLAVGYVPRATLAELFSQYRRFGSWKVRYWRSTDDRPQARQLLLLGTPLAAVLAIAAWLRLGRKGRVLAATAAAASVVVFDRSGPSGPRGGMVAHGYGVVASASVAAGWVTGVATELAAGESSSEPTTGSSIVYVVSRWGEPSQTFVRREALALADLGASVHAMSLKRPGRVDAGIDAGWAPPARVLGGLVKVARRRPMRTARVFTTVVRRSAPRNVPRQLVAAGVGMSWVGSGNLPAGHLHAHFGWVAATATWAAAQVSGRPYSVSLHAFEIHDERFLDDFTGVPLCSAHAVFTESHRDPRDRGPALGRRCHGHPTRRPAGLARRRRQRP